MHATLNAVAHRTDGGDLGFWAGPTATQGLTDDIPFWMNFSMGISLVTWTHGTRLAESLQKGNPDCNALLNEEKSRFSRGYETAGEGKCDGASIDIRKGGRDQCHYRTKQKKR